MTKRRQLIKAASGVASIGFINTVSAHNGRGRGGNPNGRGKGRNKGTSDQLADDELGEQIFEAFVDDGSAGAREVVEDKGVGYDLSMGKPDIKQNTDSDISPQNTYPESESSVEGLVSGVRGYDDRVWFTTYVQLRGSSISYAPSMNVDDVVSILYNDTHWTVVDEPIITTDHDYDFGNQTPLEASFTTDTVTDGLAGVVDVEMVSDPDNIRNNVLWPGNIILQTQLKNETGTPNTLWAAYEHTQAPFVSGSIIDISVDISVGSLNVSLGGGASDVWNVPVPLDPEEALNS